MKVDFHTEVSEMITVGCRAIFIWHTAVGQDQQLCLKQQSSLSTGTEKNQ